MAKTRGTQISPAFSKENQSFPGSAFRFADFVLQPSERLLTKAGVPISLQPKTFDALMLLVIRAEHLVSKRELFRLLWPDTHVSPANLTNIIVALRKLLGRDSIRTVSKHGYRFHLPILSEPGVDAGIYEHYLQARTIIQTRSLEQMPRARDLLALCLAKAPLFAQGWAWQGRCCLFLDKFGDSQSLNAEVAEASFERALTLQPDLTDAHAFLTLHQVDSGRAADAIDRLVKQLQARPNQPGLYAGLVHALRFQGLLHESLEAHKCAIDLDPETSTSVAHTLFLAGDFPACIEAYTGRTQYYLDAAAWAALGITDKAASLLDRRISTLPLSPMLRTLMQSLLFIVRGERKEALKAMESSDLRSEPEIIAYFARHYSYLGKGQKAVLALQAAAASGFVYAPETLSQDPWLASLRQTRAYPSILDAATLNVQAIRRKYKKEFRTLNLSAS